MGRRRDRSGLTSEVELSLGHLATAPGEPRGSHSWKPARHDTSSLDVRFRVGDGEGLEGVMDPAKTQVAAQKLIARAMAEAEAGRLDPRIHRALQQRIVILKPLRRQRGAH